MESRIRSIPRPRNPADVHRWIHQMGAIAIAPAVRPVADWRAEVEMDSPCTPDILIRGLYLHHLLRALVLGCAVDPLLQNGPATGPAVVLSRTQFLCHTEQHFGPDAMLSHRPQTTVFAREWLARVFERAGIAVHSVSRYPLQPRPFDLTPRDFSRLSACMVTPKVNGFEPSLGLANGGLTPILSGRPRLRHGGHPALGAGGGLPTQASLVSHGSLALRCAVWPFILEGEVLAGDTQEALFLGYDCVLSPMLPYFHGHRHGTRQVALQNIVRLVGPCIGALRLATKPLTTFATNPRDALTRCHRWAQHTGVPCDGVIFADGSAPSYSTPDRLWKLKARGRPFFPPSGGRSRPPDFPTIDYRLCAVNNHRSLYELMLRAGEGSIQSLHRFRCTRGQIEDFVVPVLLEHEGLHSGQVVEVAVQVGDKNRVHFPTMQPFPWDPSVVPVHRWFASIRWAPPVRRRYLRSSLKPPSARGRQTAQLTGGRPPRRTGRRPHLWAAMDIIHAKCNVAGFLQPDNPVLTRVCIEGPLRHWKNHILQQGLEFLAPHTA